MKYTFFLYLVLGFTVIGLASCASMNESDRKDKQGETLFRSDAYTVYPDRVQQGLYEAAALTSTSMITNYQSPANDRHPRGIEFKFSLNGKDNELPVGVNHFLVLRPEDGFVASPLITFGKHFADTAQQPTDDFLEANTQFRLRLNMRPVLDAFAGQGYYQDYAGNRIYKEDFKGVYVAGAAEPMSWDFENLPNREGLELTDPDEDGIYETILTLNKYNPENFTANRWELSEDISKYPTYTSEQVLIDALYNLSLEEMVKDVRSDKTFMAGAKWNGVWTRDISYSIVLSLAMLEPEIAKNSLMAKVRNKRIIQDTGTGGSWPVSTDRMTWALAAWEIYAVTGDKTWLKEAFAIIRNSVEDDLYVAFDGKSGLFRGESSFLDWRKQTYPRWMGPVPIYLSENLGTNVVHYETYRILGRMGDLLGENTRKYTEIADQVKNSLNTLLWQEDRNFYGQYRYGHNFMVLSPRAEALGEALSVLYEVAEGERADAVIQHTPVTTYGITSIYPQIPDVPPYHNQGIWPFVQAYWNWAAARRGNQKAVEHGLGAIYRQAALFLTNKENFVANNGDFQGTEINSDRQLWSVAGNLAMVYRVFFGMDFTEEGIALKPFVPKAYAGDRTLKGFKYRKATLTIELKGWGNEIAELLIDGISLGDALIPNELEGEHIVEIYLKNGKSAEKSFTLVPNHVALPTVQAALNGQRLEWKSIPGATGYQVYRNGQAVAEAKETFYAIPPATTYTEWAVAAIDSAGWTSFIGEPVVVNSQAADITLEVENFADKATANYAGFKGEGFVELSTTENAQLSFSVEVAEAGTYVLDFRYSNGSGPINTDNKCAIRSLYLGNSYVAPVVLPQLGSDEWSNWGYSNPIEIKLPAGKFTLNLRLEEWNRNMNVAVNRAMLDQLRLMRLN